MLCCHPRLHLTKVTGKWQSWNIDPGVLTLSLVLFSALLPVLSTLFSSCPCFAHLWVGFFWCLDSVFAMTPCISQGSFNFKLQKSHLKKIYWLMYREGWGISGVRHCWVWGLRDVIRVFSPLHFSVPPLSGFWPHSLPADVFPFGGSRYGRQQLRHTSPLLVILAERKACSSSVCMKLALFGSYACSWDQSLARWRAAVIGWASVTCLFRHREVGVLGLAVHWGHPIRKEATWLRGRE